MDATNESKPYLHTKNGQIKNSGDANEDVINILRLEVEGLKLRNINLQNEITELKSKLPLAPAMKVKISKSGAATVYGVAPWPITLNKAQWRALLADENRSRLLEFLTANETALRDDVHLNRNSKRAGGKSRG